MSAFISPEKPTTAVIGCLIDVSGSMRKALETGHGDEKAIDRLRAVLSAVLKLTRAEQQQNPDALVFTGVFGLNTDTGSPAAVDLGSVVDALLAGREDCQSGYERLISLANENNLAHITQYIYDKLTDDEARIVYMYLKRHPEELEEFVNAIPSAESLHRFRTNAQAASESAGAFLDSGASRLFGGIPGVSGWIKGAGAAMGSKAGQFGGNAVEKIAVDRSQGLKMARRICAGWLHDFVEFVPRPVNDTVHLLERLHEHAGPSNSGSTLLDTLQQYMYGVTPMRDALSRSLAAFRQNPTTGQRVLVLISDGVSTDGEPMPIAHQLWEENVRIATVYLTDDSTVPLRRLYDQVAPGWHEGQRTLFDMAHKVAGATHPIPVLASVGWEVPSSGECALYSMVRSSTALDEFCSILLSARFGSADALLDVVGRVHLDTYINNKQVRTSQNPSNQGNSRTCYAHAAAGVLHMALLRIEAREGGCPSIDEIRTKILKRFPSGDHGASTRDVLSTAIKWYRPLRFREVDEEGARQAVLRRRPVLATFHLSESGWKTFIEHFSNKATRTSVLTDAQMQKHISPYTDGGHAVVLIGCGPHELTFLNSWGHDWGNNGSFSVEGSSVLDGVTATRVAFYDIYWLEDDLTAKERKAYEDKVDEMLRARAAQHPSIFELETRCPLCKVNSPIAHFTGSIRAAKCPNCGKTFPPEPGHLVKALYARAGLRNVV